MRESGFTPFFLTLALAMLLPRIAASYPLDLRHHGVVGYGFPTQDGMLAVDLSGDGIDELLFTTSATSPLLAVFQKSDVTWQREQLFLLPERQSQTQLHAWVLPDETRVVTVALHQAYPAPPFTNVDVYADWPLRHQSSFTVGDDVNDSLIADADGDGVAELLLLGGGVLRALDPATGLLKWSTPGLGGDLLVDQLDADPAPEIVLSGPLGLVIDGATREVEYEHIGSFGSQLSSGRIGAGAAPALVAGQQDGGVVVFESDPWRSSWEFVRNGTAAVLALDVDGDAIDEILQVDIQTGTLNLIDSQSRLLRQTYPNPDGGGLNLLQLRDGSANGVIGFMSASPFSNLLRLIDPHTAQDVFSIEHAVAIAAAVAIGDVDGDGEREYVADAAGLRIFDARSGSLEWRAPIPVGPNAPFAMQTNAIHLAQLDSDPQLEIIAIGQDFHRAHVLVIDGLTREIELAFADTVAPFSFALGSELHDYDGDGWPDLVLSVGRSTSTSGTGLSVWSLQTGQQLWHSITVGEPSSYGLMLIPTPEQTLLVTATETGLYAFGATSQLLEWVHKAPIRRAVYLAEGIDGPEILLEQPNRVVRHLDASSRVELRSYQLPEPSRTIVPLPGEQRYLFRGENLLQAYAMNGVAQPIASVPFAPGPAGLSIAVASDGDDHELLIGTHYGYAAYRYSIDGVFAEDFE